MATKMSKPNFPVSTLQAALAASVANGTFSDTAYYLYSRRGANAKAHSPLPVFASSTVMRACSEYFAKQLSNPLPADTKIPEESDDYDYDTDSDLDEDEVLDDIEDGMSDMSSVRSVSSCATEQPDQSKARDEPSESFNIVKAPTAAPRAGTDSESMARAKHKIFIPNVAATTWKALIYYVYTGDVFFAPVKSSGGEARQLAKSKEPADGPSFCSPKSMYRLAGLVGLSDVKKLAKQAIEGGLSEDCIADEIFSKFSSCHPEILQMQLAYLYDRGRLARVMPKIKARVKASIRGGMTHVEVVLDSLLDKLSERMPAAAPSPMVLRPKQPPGSTQTKPSSGVAPSSPRPSSTVPPSVSASAPFNTPSSTQHSPETDVPSPKKSETSKWKSSKAQSTSVKSEAALPASRPASSPELSAASIPSQPTKSTAGPPSPLTGSAPVPPVDSRAQRAGPGQDNATSDSGTRKGPAVDTSPTAKVTATTGAPDQRAQATQERRVCQRKSGECSCSKCLKVKPKPATDSSSERISEVIRSLQVNVWDTPS